MRRDLELRLAQAEIANSATDWADYQQAQHRRGLRAAVNLHSLIRSGLLAMGLDPALAVSLQRGEEAAAELASIPDSEALQGADDAVTRSGAGDSSGANKFNAKIERIVASFRNGNQPDLSNASPIELLAFCIANDALPRCYANLSPAQLAALCYTLTYEKIDSILRRHRCNPSMLNTD